MFSDCFKAVGGKVCVQMEATFTLYTSRQQLAFMGDISVNRMKFVFKNGDEAFL